MGVLDQLSWVPNPTEGFMVKSCYSVLIDSGGDRGINVQLKKAIRHLWACDVPSKI